MKIIGVVTRTSISDEGHVINLIYNDIYKAVNKTDIVVIGIIPDKDYKKVIDICDGIIFQGGDNFEEYDLEILKYIYDIDKPVLGICLGMQVMSMLFNGTMDSVTRHKDTKKYSHGITIDKKSKLYKIINMEHIMVNSRHKDIITNTELFISARDGKIIEAVEDPNKKFFIGIQWHPESMISYDDIENNIFKKFIELL